MATKVLKGPKGHAGGLFGSSDGKGAVSATAPTGQKAPLPGLSDPMSRVMGQYGKASPQATGAPMDTSADPNVDPAASAPSPTMGHPGMSKHGGAVMRDSTMRSNPKQGGLLPANAKQQIKAMSD